ncbi:hypothetical protein AC249_AIPGENE24150 [Exaiptasia diaphana]|nr:hypothetical protein AC249_AIPGENE24150 [Exaiptasia diaphana]
MNYTQLWITQREYSKTSEVPLFFGGLELIRICGVILVLYCIGRVWWSDFSLKGILTLTTCKSSVKKNAAAYSNSTTDFSPLSLVERRPRDAIVPAVEGSHQIYFKIYDADITAERQYRDFLTSLKPNSAK